MPPADCTLILAITRSASDDAASALAAAGGCSLRKIPLDRPVAQCLVGLGLLVLSLCDALWGCSPRMAGASRSREHQDRGHLHY